MPWRTFYRRHLIYRGLNRFSNKFLWPSFTRRLPRMNSYAGLRTPFLKRSGRH